MKPLSPVIQKDFFTFVQKMMLEQGIDITKDPYIGAMCHKLQELVDGTTSRLAINAPPRHGKSQIGVVALAAYVLGRYPSARILTVSCNETLGRTNVDATRDLVLSKFYREAFPGTRIREDHSRSGDFKTTAGGGMVSMSIHAQPSGTGFHYLLADDILDVNDWNNEEAIEKAVRTLESLLMTRFENGKAGRAVFTGHRLNAEDPTARLMRTGEWRLLRLSHKAVKDEIWDLGHRKYIRRRGELLRPDIFDEKTLARLEQTQVAPPYAYYYQQGASEKAAPIAKPGHFRNYCGELSPVQHVVMSIDPAQKGGDRSSYNVIQIWVTDGERHYLKHQWRKRCGYRDLKKAFLALRNKYRPSAIIIEETANGSALIDKARRKSAYLVVPVVPDSRPKVMRLSEHYPTIADQRILLPGGADWRRCFVEEVVNFPRLGTDQVDAMTQFLDFMQSNPQLRKPAETGTAGLSAATPFSQTGLPGHHGTIPTPRSDFGRCGILARRQIGPSIRTLQPLQPGEPAGDEHIIIVTGLDARRYRMK